MNTTESHSNYLEAFKGIAIIAVTLIHIGGGVFPGKLGQIVNNGNRGVQLFFIISGLLAFVSLSHFFPNRKQMNPKKILQWYWMKITRLAPMFYLAILISMLTKGGSTYWLGNEGHVTIKNIVAHLFFLHGFFPHYTNSVLGVDWYLGVLVIFFLITPLLYYFIDTFEKSLLLLLATHIIYPWANAKLAGILPVSSDPEIYNTYVGCFGPLAQIYVYCLGIVLYFVITKLDRQEKTKGRKLLSYILLIFSAMMMNGSITSGTSLYRLSYTDTFGIWLAIAIISQYIYSSKLIVNRFFEINGKYSYGIYLFQFIWLNFYGRHLNNIGFFNHLSVKFIASVFALLLISYLLTTFFDEPVHRLIKNTSIREMK